MGRRTSRRPVPGCRRHGLTTLAGIVLAFIMAGSLTHPANGELRSMREPITAVNPPTKVIGYLASWGIDDQGFKLADLNGDQLTHIVYAFGRVGSDGLAALADPCMDAGKCASGEPAIAGGNFAELRSLKKRYPHLKFLVGLGGWNGSAHFSDAAATPQARSRFAASAIDAFIQDFPGLFDGFDLDWEYPVEGGLAGNVVRPEDGANLTLLVEEFRRQLDALAGSRPERYLLTLAVSASPAKVATIDAKRLSEVADWIGVMTYDYHAGSDFAHFNAPLFDVTGDPTPELNVDASIGAYLAAGVPPQRLVLGIPFYARVYGNVAHDNDGLFRPADPAAPTGWPSNEPNYRSLIASHPLHHGFVRYWHPEAEVPWLYSRAANVWITYDDPDAVSRKTEYARSHKLGGVMAWEVTGDDGSLLAAIHRVLDDRRISGQPLQR